MSGCDYIPNIKGIGMMSILRVFTEKSDFNKIKELLISKKYSNNEISKYLRKVSLIKNTFKYQYVYDQVKQIMIYKTPMTEIKEDINWNTNILSDYIGKSFPNITEFVKGKLDISTMKERTPVNIDFDKIVRFLRFRPNHSHGRLNNLCAHPISYSNFDLNVRSLEEYEHQEVFSDNSNRVKTPEQTYKRTKTDYIKSWSNADVSNLRKRIIEQSTADKNSSDSFRPAKNRYK